MERISERADAQGVQILDKEYNPPSKGLKERRGYTGNGKEGGSSHLVPDFLSSGGSGSLGILLAFLGVLVLRRIVMGFVWVVLIAGVIYIFWRSSGGGHRYTVREDPLEVLKKLYTREEYERIKRDLEL